MRFFRRRAIPLEQRDALAADPEVAMDMSLAFVDIAITKFPLFMVMIDYASWLKKEIAHLKQNNIAEEKLAERERQLEALETLARRLYIEKSEGITKSFSEPV